MCPNRRSTDCAEGAIQRKIHVRDTFFIVEIRKYLAKMRAQNESKTKTVFDFNQLLFLKNKLGGLHEPENLSYFFGSESDSELKHTVSFATLLGGKITSSRWSLSCRYPTNRSSSGSASDASFFALLKEFKRSSAELSPL